MQNRRRAQDVRNEPASLTDRDQFLSFSLRERTGKLALEMGRSDQFMDVLLIRSSELEGLGLERVAQHPVRGDRRIKDVFHVSSSSSWNSALIVSGSISPWTR